MQKCKISPTAIVKICSTSCFTLIRKHCEGNWCKLRREVVQELTLVVQPSLLGLSQHNIQ